MPSRLEEYEKIIQTAKASGYEHLTIPEFYHKIKKSELAPDKKYFIHRHDIDTDTNTARFFFEIEKKHEVKTSYYFRLSTLDINLMCEIQKYGSEVGYHYEELAQYCKDHKVKSAQEIKKHFAPIRDQFKENFKRVEAKVGFKIKSIVSHGDFVNRKTGVPNHEFITSELMEELEIELEGYDPLLLEQYKIVLSDSIYPDNYTPQNPFDCLSERHKVIYLLTHPRHWKVARWINTKDNLQRLIEGIKY